MEARHEVRKREMLRECEVSPDLFKDMLKRLGEFAEPFVQSLWRKEQKEHARTYLCGLLSDLERKNVESVAYRFGRERRGMQRFVGWSSWDHEPLLEELARQVGAQIGEQDGVIVFDPSGFKKKGKRSVGVARQWLGRLGKVDNGQVAVYMAYASRLGHTLVDTRLYLPKEWTDDTGRCRDGGVPAPLRRSHRTRHVLALEMLEDKGPVLPHAWVAGDDEMGRSTKFRRQLRDLEEHYLLAVPSNTNVRDLNAPRPAYKGRGAPRKQPFQRADNWRASLPPNAWTRIDVRDGEKGPLVMEIAKTPVVARTENSRAIAQDELLVVTRVLDEDKEIKHDYYLSNAPADTPLEELARVAKAEYRVEECIKRGKSEAGLADYEVRTWTGWHHHQALSLIAVWFLTSEVRRGKKMDAVDHRATDPRGPRIDTAPRFGLCRSRQDRRRANPPPQTQRGGTTLSLENA